MRGEKLERLIFWVFELSKAAIILFILGLFVYHFALTIFIVEGASMEPDFKNGQIVLVDKFSYLIKSPKRGDVVF